MFDRITVLDIIDRAFDSHRTCATCGAPTVLRSDAGRVLLECSDLRRDGLLARIGGFLMPHTELTVLDRFEDLAA